MDDLPLLLTHMQRMHLAELLDKHIPTHGQRKGLSVGELSVVWLAHILSQADHRMNRVQEWATRRLSTLRGCGMSTLCPQDVTDDRLADVLRLLSDDVHWQACEQELMEQLVRVYDLPATCVRINTTTASSYAEVNEQGLLQLGHSKDHRPDLPQLKLVLASLDPLGIPLATEVLSGEHADDPVYLPIIARVRDGLQQKGLLYVGDCKMAALQTRASIAAQGDFYLCPLSALQAPPKQVGQEVDTKRTQGARLLSVCRVDEQGTNTCIAQGYETIHLVTAQGDGETQSWQERRLLIQSMAATRAAQASLQERVQKAQQELEELTARRQGKPRLTTCNEVDEAIKAVLKRFRVEGLLQVQIQEHVQERPVRAYRGRLSGVRRDCTFTLTCMRDEMAIAKAMSELGWRVYATNHLAEDLTLEQAVEAYRDEYLVERNFARLKGRPLSLAPLYVQRDDHRVGLVRLLTLALRVLTLLEGVVRQRLGEQKEELAGLFAGNPKRRTAQPTAERLLEAFREVTLTVVSAPSFAQRHVTPLSPLQQRILALFGFSPAVYLGLADDS
nr:IS1634 family transposase [Ktedonobacter racemifer]